MKIETWFPTSIAIVENVISKKEHNFLKNKIIKLNKEVKEVAKDKKVIYIGTLALKLLMENTI